jgi:methanogenic corrinoid protein MtbC1
MEQIGALGKALLAMDENKTIEITRERLQAGDEPLRILEECNHAMVEIGRRFEAGQFFISELIMSGEIMKQVMVELTPHLKEEDSPTAKGAVVIGTVKDDIHDIGKNIVVTLLSATGYDVHDLGVDVPAERFLGALAESGARVLGLSALLSFTYPRMKEVIELLSANGTREETTVVIGGAPCNEEVRVSVGADFVARDAGKGVAICGQVYGVSS